MSKISNKLIWGLPLIIAICFGLVIVGFFSYKHYRFAKAKTDLFSCEKKRMGSAFAYLLKRGNKGLGIIADFCRKHSNQKWSDEVNGLRSRIIIDSFIFRTDEIRGTKKTIFKLEVKNVSDAQIEIARWDDVGRNIRLEWALMIEPNGKINRAEYDPERGGGFAERHIIKPGDVLQTKITSEHLFEVHQKALYYRTFYYGIVWSEDYGVPIANRITFAVVP